MIKFLYKYLFSELEKLEAEYNSFTIRDEKNIADYFKIKTQIINSSKEFARFITNPVYILPFLNTGRLLKVCLNNYHVFSIIDHKFIIIL